MAALAPIPPVDMSTRLTIAGRQAAPVGAMTACALMSMTSKIITDPSGPELARAT